MKEACAYCGASFETEDGFVGDLSGDTDCHFMTVITSLCQTCYSEIETHSHDSSDDSPQVLY